MPLDEGPTEANHSDPRFGQQILSDVEAQSIQIGRIVQTIVYLGLPFNNRHLRFLQFLANSTYLACLVGGFIRLWQNGADFITLLLLIVGSGLLSLTCLYYAGFWKPEVQDKSAPSSELPDSDERVKAQQTKQRSRQRLRRLAMFGVFAIPLLTCAGFFVWQSLPAPRVLLLVADFYVDKSQNYQATDNILTRNILWKLWDTTKGYADVKVQALNQTITEQQGGSEAARAAGKQKKASIVIWGGYGVTETNVQVSVYFEVLKPPNYFPQLEKTARGEAQILAIAELNSFKLQTDLSNNMSYLTLFTLGMVEYAKEDWNGAIRLFRSALEQVNEPATTLGSATTLGQEAVYFYLGNSHLSKSDYKNAIANYTSALKLEPDDAGAYNNRGTAYFDQGNYTQAIADYNYALKLEPDDAAAYNNRGTAYSNQGNYTQAIADYNYALKLEPNFAAAYNNRGTAYFDQGNYTQAIADYNSVLKLEPNFAAAYNNRGTAYFGQGNYTQAIADYNYALKLEPDDAGAYYNRGNAYSDQGNYTQAIADYNSALKLEPDDAGAYYNKACAYSLKREVKAAIENLQRAIDLDAKYREDAKTDSDFDNIREDKQFRALVGQ